MTLLTPDFSKLKVVVLTRDMAESCAPMNITVSYAGQDGTPKPFLMIINWIKVGKHWKVASNHGVRGTNETVCLSSATTRRADTVLATGRGWDATLETL
jgi:hypothetical protein